VLLKITEGEGLHTKTALYKIMNSKIIITRHDRTDWTVK